VLRKWRIGTANMEIGLYVRHPHVLVSMPTNWNVFGGERGGLVVNIN
jgi:hypothetical protein